MNEEIITNEEAVLDAEQENQEIESVEAVEDAITESEEKEEEALQTKYLRLAADFQNFRRRSEKEKIDIYAYANEKIVVELLSVIDSFERAMEHKYEDGESKLMEGMEMILKQLNDLLEKNHVEEINALSQPFDPHFHHAVMTEENEETESGIVIKVLQKGYLLNKKVIRPAMVVVTQ